MKHGRDLPQRTLFLRVETSLLLLAGLVFLAATSPASAQPPPGYRFFSGAPQVSGGLFLAKFQRAHSAIQALKDGFRDTAPFFDGRPRVVAGIVDARDQEAETAFRSPRVMSPWSARPSPSSKAERRRSCWRSTPPIHFPKAFPDSCRLPGFRAKAAARARRLRATGGRCRILTAAGK